MTQGSFTDTWPTPAEAAAMNAAAADVQSAVASAASLLDHFRLEMEEGKLRDDAGRRAVQALAEICGLALQRVAEGPAEDVSDYASRVSDAASSFARPAPERGNRRTVPMTPAAKRAMELQEEENSHADQP